MTDNSEKRDYLVTLEQYWAAGERGENDDSAKNQPKPPNADVAWDVVTICSKAIGQLLDFKKTGVLPDFSQICPRKSA